MKRYGLFLAFFLVFQTSAQAGIHFKKDMAEEIANKHFSSALLGAMTARAVALGAYVEEGKRLTDENPELVSKLMSDQIRKDKLPALRASLVTELRANRALRTKGVAKIRQAFLNPAYAKYDLDAQIFIYGKMRDLMQPLENGMIPSFTEAYTEVEQALFEGFAERCIAMAQRNARQMGLELKSDFDFAKYGRWATAQFAVELRSVMSVDEMRQVVALRNQGALKEFERIAYGSK